MSIHFRNKIALEYKGEISRSFEALVDYFNFEPGDIFVEILPLEEFERFYIFERGHKPFPFIVGSALNNSRILILDKKDFPKKQGHTEDEFESVILHELAHIFVRRLTWPVHAPIWIQEGICEYLSFGDKGFHVKKFVSFKEIETEEGWDKHNPYQQAGAFFAFLSKNYGDEKIVKLIKGFKNNHLSLEEYFSKIYKKGLHILEEEFKVFLGIRK